MTKIADFFRSLTLRTTSTVGIPQPTVESPVDETPATTIARTSNGRYALFNDGDFVADYASRAGALRGAARRDLTVTEA